MVNLHREKTTLLLGKKWLESLMQNYNVKYSGLGQGTLCIQQQLVEVFLEEDRIHSQMIDLGSISVDFYELEECC